MKSVDFTVYQGKSSQILMKSEDFLGFQSCILKDCQTKNTVIIIECEMV